MIEGVIATIEVKSDLSTGNPNGLISAIKNVSTVLRLQNQAMKIRGNKQEFRKLLRARSVKTFVVGYKGWTTKDATLENYKTAAKEVGRESLPDIVYQPNGCVIKNSDFINIFRTQENQKVSTSFTPFVYCPQYPFALFFQNLLRAILNGTGGLIATAPGINAEMQYPLNNYLSLPRIPCDPFNLSEDD